MPGAASEAAKSGGKHVGGGGFLRARSGAGGSMSEVVDVCVRGAVRIEGLHFGLADRVAGGQGKGGIGKT